MAISSTEIKSSYPLPVYNYRVTVLDISGPQVLGFSEVSGLSASYELITYKDGLSFLAGDKHIPGMRQPIKVTLKKGLTKNGDFIQNWFDRCYRLHMATTSRCDIIIDLCDEQGLPVIRWKLIQALPVKLDVPNFVANSNEAAIVTMDVIAADLTTDYDPS